MSLHPTPAVTQSTAADSQRHAERHGEPSSPADRVAFTRLGEDQHERGDTLITVGLLAIAIAGGPAGVAEPSVKHEAVVEDVDSKHWMSIDASTAETLHFRDDNGRLV